MARKRKKLGKFDYQSPEYWNHLLVEEGLAVDRGKHPRRLVYVGGEAELSVIEKYINLNGQKLPHPRGD